MIRARNLNKRVEIWESVEISNGFGGTDVSFQLVGSGWADVKSVSSNSRYVSRLTELGYTDLKNAIIVTMRKRNDINYNGESQYLRYYGKKYIIQSVTDKDLEGVEVEIVAVSEDRS